MIKKFCRKNSISPYVYSVIFGFLLYRIYDFMIKCSNDGILRTVPTIIFGAITTYIAYQQHKISSAQKDIAADKHRLELFEKRFEIYQLFLDMAVQSHKLSPNHRVDNNLEDYDDIIESNSGYIKFIENNENKIISLGEGSIFLFGPEVKIILDEARGNIFKKLKFVKILNGLRDKKGPSNNFIGEITEKDPLETVQEKAIIECDKFLKDFYERKLSEKMEPYLRMTPYLSKF